MSHPAFQVIAQIARSNPADLTPETRLERLGLNSSLGLGILRSALERRFQRRLGPLTWQTTVAQIVAALEGDPAPGGSAAGAAAPAAGPFGPFGGRVRSAPFSLPDLGHGIDIQEIASLPEWREPRDPFYGTHFTADELAEAVRRPDPRAHLCGIWCAKEAVKKADPALLALDFAEIGIVTDAAGRPSVRLASPALQAAFGLSLSISHSANCAVASVVALRR